MSTSADQAFPHVARFVRGYGWIEIGDDGMSPSWIRVLDEGGMIWESAERYPTLDDALRTADAAIAEWVRSVLGEDWSGPRDTRRRPPTGRRTGADTP